MTAQQRAPTADHEAIHRTKLGQAYTTDDGREVPQHTLHLFDCSCGYLGMAWYADEGRAKASHERHAAIAPMDTEG